MRKYITALFAAGLTACAQLPIETTDTMTQASVVDANTSFALDLYNFIREDDQNALENIFISPASLYTAFGLLYHGAAGETADELNRALYVTKSPIAHMAALGRLQKDIQSDDEGRRVSINNALWVEKTSVLEQPYLDIVKTAFDASIMRVDYVNAFVASRKRINTWVEDKTEDRIKDLLPESAVTKTSRNILVNTIYLDADWQNPFAKEGTRPDDFELLSGQIIQTEMMHQTDTFKYAKKGSTEMLRLPYAGGELSTIIILPKTANDLEATEKALLKTPRSLRKALDKLDAAESVKVRLKLPKLKIENKFELSDALKTLGMTRAFSNGADFTNMAIPSKQPDRTGFKIGKVIHQTFLEVDEQGTEAAAASAIMLVTITSSKAGYVPPIPFEVNRPHLMLIRHEPTGMILFLGRITKPN